jgi:ABC-type Na+ efflux pump permease subunit
MIMSALFCNQFGFDGAGLRTLILAPIPRRAILAGKNCALLVVAFVCAVAVLGFNELLFRDLTPQALAFAALCFILFAAEFVIVGNWLSVRYPKRLEFGKRMNTSGMASLLLMPLLVTVFVPPALAVYAGYRAQSLMVEYVILTLFALAAVALYLLHLGAQARAFTRRELAILDAVAGRDE